MVLPLLAVLALDTTHIIRVPVAERETLTVTVTGLGPDVVMLPGMFGSSFAYRHVARLLEGEGYRSVRIDLLGMGSSTKPKDADYSLTAQADRIAAVLDTLGIDEAVVVGHSVAASVAMRLAYRHSGRVRAIVSVEGGPAEKASTGGFRRLLRFAPALRMTGAMRGLPALVRRELKSVSYDDSWVDRDIVRGYTEGLMRDPRATLDGFQGIARAQEPVALRDYLWMIECPVVLLVSSKRHTSGPSADEISTLEEHLSSFAVDTIPQTGYFIQEERPGAIVDVVVRLSR